MVWSAVNIYARPRTVTDLKDCYFYHTMDIPGYGRVEGEWDLRPGIRQYLGNVDFSGKRVLEMGTASGYVCFHMESHGAEVVGYDLSGEQTWDVVPFAQYEYGDFIAKRKEHVTRLNNAFWLCHRAFGSQSKMVYGDVYSVPEEIGPVDICVFGSILLHVRDPFLALQKSLRLTRETVIITDLAGRFNVPSALRSVKRLLPGNLGRPSVKFVPDWRRREPKETWWRLSPEAIREFVGVLGFEKTEVIHHYQEYYGRKRKRKLKLFTVVGNRTVGMPGSDR